ncbi:MAG: hypothetical protein ACRDST_23190 [Pseudonocardiaceae bacterium]
MALGPWCHRRGGCDAVVEWEFPIRRNLVRHSSVEVGPELAEVVERDLVVVGGAAAPGLDELDPQPREVG